MAALKLPQARPEDYQTTQTGKKKAVMLSLARNVLALADIPRSQTRNFPLFFYTITKWVTVFIK